jgi:hypothetical protein
MPRIRALKPETPQDEKLARVSRDARLTFLYCLTIADDDGLFRANPRQLLGQLFPSDEALTERELMGWVEELVEVAGCLRWRTTRDNAPVLEIVNWEKHQHITKKSRPFIAELLLPVETPVSFSYCSPIRREVWERDHGRCGYCGVSLLNPPFNGAFSVYPGLCLHPKQATVEQADRFAEIDHVVPVAHGGLNTPSNLRLSCRKCNRAKGVRAVESFAETLGNNPDAPEIISVRSPEVLESLSPEVLPRNPGSPNPDVVAVLEHYHVLHPGRWPFDDTGKPKAPAQRAVKRALGWGFTVDQLKAALTANATDAWHRTHKKHELEYVLRTEDKIRGWVERATTEDEPVYAGITFVN